MKTYSFDICKYHVAITIEKRKYETTVKDVFDELTEEQKYKLIDRLKMAKDLVKSQPDEIKMEVPKTVSECVTEYIDSQRGIMSDATIKGYENIRDKHFAGLMSCRMKYIDDGVIQRSFNEEIEKGYSKKTIKGYRSFILKVLAVYRPDLKPEIRVEKKIAE